MFKLFRNKHHRHAILFVVAALLLAYAGLFQHQATHYGSGETDCVQCLAASHFGHAPTSTGLTLSLPTATERPSVAAVAGFTSFSIRYFSARAPPIFL
jgi:hypothetical protein